MIFVSHPLKVWYDLFKKCYCKSVFSKCCLTDRQTEDERGQGCDYNDTFRSILCVLVCVYFHPICRHVKPAANILHGCDTNLCGINLSVNLSPQLNLCQKTDWGSVFNLQRRNGHRNETDSNGDSKSESPSAILSLTYWLPWWRPVVTVHMIR